MIPSTTRVTLSDLLSRFFMLLVKHYFAQTITERFCDLWSERLGRNEQCNLDNYICKSNCALGHYFSVYHSITKLFSPGIHNFRLHIVMPPLVVVPNTLIYSNSPHETWMRHLHKCTEPKNSHHTKIRNRVTSLIFRRFYSSTKVYIIAVAPSGSFVPA